MQILESKVLARAGVKDKVYLALHELTLEDKGKRRPYFMVTRGDKIIPPSEKRPEAVIIVAVCRVPGEGEKLVVTSEYRAPIADFEIGFPAGMIDSQDYDKAGGDPTKAAEIAAGREFFEETGMTLEITEISPPRLYSSAGMTDEMSIIVFGFAHGKRSQDHCEEGENIETLLFSREEVTKLIGDGQAAFSKVCWPFLWAYSKNGF